MDRERRLGILRGLLAKLRGEPLEDQGLQRQPVVGEPPETVLELAPALDTPLLDLALEAPRPSVRPLENARDLASNDQISQAVRADPRPGGGRPDANDLGAAPLGGSSVPGDPRQRRLAVLRDLLARLGTA